MRINSSGGSQEATLEDNDAGEGLAVFFSQNGGSTARYRFRIKAIFDEGVYDVGEFYSSPPLSTSVPGRLSRMIGGAVCPGARSWRVAVECVNVPLVEDDTADIVLSSSRCYAQLGCYRVGERYQYAAGVSGQTFTVLPGMSITGISGIGGTGGGSIQVGSDDLVTVPEGVSANLEPKAPIAPETVIAFTNVDWIVEYTESA